MMTSFSDLACRRRSHRQYTEEKVEEKDIRTILRAALMAPSARGRRNWHFFVTEDREKISAISAIREHGSHFLAGAPLAIAVLGKPEENDLWLEDCALAAVSMQYQIEDLGLGSCWCHINGRESIKEDSNAEKEVRKILGIPEEYSVLCVLGIGHAADERKIQEEASLKWDQVHREKF